MKYRFIAAALAAVLLALAAWQVRQMRVLAAACTPQAVTDRTADLRRGYCLGYQELLRQAVGRGLPDDYTSAPLRDAQRKAAGLTRPACTKKGATHE